MGDPRGFLKIKRDPTGDPREQASRCMDCGTPYCHGSCPLGNYIPEWNDLASGTHWDRAFELLDATNNMPEITGRLCPAPCEAACLLGLNFDPVDIKQNELTIIENAFKSGWVKPRPPRILSDKKVAVVGSGPAGLSCAAKLNRAGHQVTVFERDDRIGGLLRYGIPDFKLDKKILDRRLRIWEAEGIRFVTKVNIGVNYPTERLKQEFDAVVWAGGSRLPRDLNIEGRRLKGIHFALDYLIQYNRRMAGKKLPAAELIDAKNKKVVVIGGGDTGADCAETARQQGAASITQIEILPQPAVVKECVGVERHWSVSTNSFWGQKQVVQGLECVKLDNQMKFEIEAELVILALGFLKTDNLKTDENYMTSEKGIFAAGDMRRGQSLIVWAIFEGRSAAAAVGRFLKEKK